MLGVRKVVPWEAEFTGLLHGAVRMSRNSDCVKTKGYCPEGD